MLYQIGDDILGQDRHAVGLRSKVSMVRNDIVSTMGTWRVVAAKITPIVKDFSAEFPTIPVSKDT